MNKHFLFLFFAFAALAFVGCDSDDDFTPPNYVNFERDNPVTVGVEVGGTATHEISVYTANITSNDRVFNLGANESTTLDATAYTLPATVTVPSGTNEGTFTVEVGDKDLGLLGKKLIIDLEGTSEVAASTTPYTISVTRTCVGKEFVIAFEFDGYANETTWELLDSEGNVVVTGGGYEEGAESASRSLCLDQGTYTFTVADEYGDGLTYPEMGSITFTYAGEVIAVLPGDYGYGTSVEITF